MNKLTFVLIFLFVQVTFAGDLVAPFHGVNTSGLCSELCVSETVACFDGTINSSNELEDKTENLVTYSEEIDDSNDWIVAGTASVQNDVAYSPYGTLTADLVTIGTSGNGVSQIDIDVGDAGDPYSPSFWINANGETGTLVFENSEASASGQWTIDLSKLSGWERVSRNHHAVVVVNEMIGHTSGECGPSFYMSVGTASIFIWGNQVESQRGYYHVGPYIHTEGSIPKTRLNLTPAGSPPSILSDSQDANGNRVMARSLNGTDQWYSHAYDALMSMWDTDCTLTFLVKSNSSGDILLGNGVSNSNGLHVYVGATFYNVYFNKLGVTSAYAQSATCTPPDGRYHVLQVVRKDNMATVYADGVPGTPVDVTGFGSDHSRVLYLGRYDGAGLEWPGSILYTRIDRRALSEDELAVQADYLSGMFTSQSKNLTTWDIVRATTATTEFSNGTMATVAASTPRVSGKGGGLLVERQSTNLLLYSQQFDQWGVLRASIIADTAEVLAPDGTQTVDIIHEDATAGSTHYTGQGSIGVEANTDYIFSVYVKPINRNWVMVEFDAASTDGFASFNLDTNYIGTAANCTAFVEDSVNGFKRVGIIWNSTTNTTVSGLLLPEEANNDTVFDGLDQDSLYVWGAQVEEGEYATSYIPTVATAVTRTADDVTLERPIAGRINWPVEPTFELDFSQDPSGATITSNTGQVLTKQGNPSRIHDNTLPDGVGGGKGYAHSFDGTNDFYTRADDGTFDPAGDFSVCAAVTPVDVSSGSQIIFGKYIRNTDDIGWYLNQYDSTFEVYVSKDGTIAMREYVNTSGGAAVAGRLAFLCATYDYKTDGTSVLRLYVDGATVLEKTDTTGPVNDSSGALFAAAFLSSGTTAEANITIHHLAYFDGYVLTADNFTNVYNQWNNLVVDAGIPPTITGPFTVEFEAKCEYADNTQISADKTLLSIDYEDANTDTFEVSIDSDGKINASLYDSTDTQHTLQSAADPVSFNEWFKVKAYMDLSDLAQNDMWINGSNTSITKTGNSGSASWSTLLSKLRLGQDYSGIAGYSDCRIRNLRLSPKRF